MLLSNIEIQRALDEGRLIIDPQPLPRRPAYGLECPYGTHSVDLRLHHQISVPKGGTFNYDLTRQGSLSELLWQHSDKYTLNERQPYILEPSTFILASTLEKIELPIVAGQGLAARIEGKSSRARCGILVHFTAPTVHPGFKGRLTLEMINMGTSRFTLVPGMPIAQLILEQVYGEIFENPSVFQGQDSPEGMRV